MSNNEETGSAPELIVVNENEQPATERTVAFFADPRAATLLLKETITQMVESLNIQRGLVDIGTWAGLEIAHALDKARVPYELMDFGQGDRYAEHPKRDDDALSGYLRARAAGERKLDVGGLGAIDANIVLIPSTVSPNESVLDFSQGSLCGTVLTQLEEAERDCIFIDAPERGLRLGPYGRYTRSIVHVQTQPTGPQAT